VMGILYWWLSQDEHRRVHKEEMAYYLTALVSRTLYENLSMPHLKIGFDLEAKLMEFSSSNRKGSQGK